MMKKVAMRLTDLFETIGYKQTVLADENEYIICEIEKSPEQYKLNGTESEADVCNHIIDRVRELNGIKCIDNEAYERAITDCSEKNKELNKWKQIACDLYEGLKEDDEDEAIEYVLNTMEIDDERVLRELGVDSKKSDRKAMEDYINKHYDDYSFCDDSIDQLIDRAKEIYGSQWKEDIYTERFIKDILSEEDIRDRFKEDVENELSYDIRNIISSYINYDDIDIDDIADYVIDDTYYFLEEMYVVTE